MWKNDGKRSQIDGKRWQKLLIFDAKVSKGYLLIGDPKMW
jgi:hypothetical protein